MSETKPKLTSRNVAIVLGIICIVLLVSLVGAFAYYVPTVNDKNNTISSLKTENSSDVSLINELNGNISKLNDNITELQNIANLNESVVLFNFSSPYPYYYSWRNTIENAGYLWVSVSSTGDTIVEITYSFQSLNYDSQVDVGTNGTSIFPILPSSLVTMGILNGTNMEVTLMTTVTAIYYY
jgi:predicted PurR-regulated permease PerM